MGWTMCISFVFRTNRLLKKYFVMLWTRICSRKCRQFFQVALCCLIVFVLYISTSYHSVGNDKTFPIQDMNDTVFTDPTLVFITDLVSKDGVTEKNKVTGPLYRRIPLTNELITVNPSIQIGNTVPNCGLHKPCGTNSFAVHIYTGKDHTDEPRLCIDGKYILGKHLNDGGRGLNIVVMDNLTRSIVRVSHFDTYERDSNSLDTVLLTLRPGEIVFLLTFDEPSRKLTRNTKLQLFELGSSSIQSLSYRGSWYLVSQKGISGFTPYEDLHFVENNGWPEPHDVKMCIPFQINGLSIHPDPIPSHNLQRLEFCQMNENADFPLFCDADVINDALNPAPLWKQPSSINKIYDVPIIVMSGADISYLPLTLETLVRQPGIKPSNVVVFYVESNSTVVPSLVEMFGYDYEALFDWTTNCERIAEAFERARLLFSDREHFLLIGEHALLAPDFLYYMGQLLSILKKDESIAAVSALNENGFKVVSGDPTLAYRVESFTNLAVLVRSTFFSRSLCNNYLVRDPLLLSPNITGDVLVPDVSRVTIGVPTMGVINSNHKFTQTLLSNDRTITYEQNINLKYPERLLLYEYEREIQSLLETAMPLQFDTTSLLECAQNRKEFREKLYENLPLFISNATNLSSQVLVIYFHQENKDDISTLKCLTRCIGLFYDDSYPVRGMFRGILRFMLKENHALLVSSKSLYFHYKPAHVPVLKADKQLKTLVYTIA